MRTDTDRHGEANIRVSQFCERAVKMEENFHDFLQIHLVPLGAVDAITFLFFYVLLTMHFSIFILVINQPNTQNLFYNKFISCLYMFRAPCAHHQEVNIVLYSLWYHHTYR